MAFNTKYLRFISICAVLAVIIAALVLSGRGSPKVNSACGPYRLDKVVRIGYQKINAEVAFTQAQKIAGLAGRPCIEPNQAMLFDFDKPAQYPMWMKGMQFPIDMVWISTDHKVVGFYNNIKPSTYPDRFVNKKESPARYVLELKANRANELQITIGTPIQF